MDLELLDPGLENAQRRLAEDQRKLASNYGARISPGNLPTSQFLSGFRRITNGMGVWRTENDKQSKLLRAIHTSIVTYELALGAMMTAQAAARLARNRELALAAALTAANIWNPATAWKIPLALGAAAAVYGAFKVGEDAGLRAATSRQTISDRNNMSEQRNAAMKATMELQAGT